MAKKKRPVENIAPEAPAAPVSAAQAPLSNNTKRLFWLITLSIPFVFFALIEGGLRLGGYGGSYPLFVPVEGGEGLLMPNRDVAARYFASGVAVPTPNPDVFPIEKAEGTYRIIAQGGSSAAGYPFYRGASFPQMMGTRLRLAYPEREIEVVNTAMAAVNSYTLLDLADEIIDQEPDAVVIYAGHNEYFGALGAASSESLGRSPALVRTYLALRKLRTVQLLRDWLGKIRSGGSDSEAGRPPSNTLMARMVGEQQVPLGSDLFRSGENQFRENLDALLAKYQKAGIKVYVGTLASNVRDQRPFITVHQAGADTTAWEAKLQEGIALVESGDALGGIEALRRATQIDTMAADAFFVLGHALLTSGDRAGAGAAFNRARDLDALRFRAPGEFNEVIRDVAARHGATVVEVEQRLEQVSPDSLIGRATMLEHLHPNLDGYAAISDAFYDALVASAAIGPAAQPTPMSRLVRLVTPMDSLTGYIRLDQLTSSWPFRPDERQPFVLDTSRTAPFVLQKAEEVMAGASWLPAADELARFYESRNDLRYALITRRAIIQAFPFLSQPYVHLANLELRRMGATTRSDQMGYVVGLYQQAVEKDSTDGTAHAMLGALYLQAGDVPTAVDHLERAVRHAPREQQPMYNLAGAYAMSGRWDEAIRLAERLTTLDPANPNYARLLDGVRKRRL